MCPLQHRRHARVGTWARHRAGIGSRTFLECPRQRTALRRHALAQRQFTGVAYLAAPGIPSGVQPSCSSDRSTHHLGQRRLIGKYNRYFLTHFYILYTFFQKSPEKLSLRIGSDSQFLRHCANRTNKLAKISYILANFDSAYCLRMKNVRSGK